MVDQQFCLRWNNHKSTLISVFDTLLENNVLVDCTLAAEGQYLKAHKVVLCACSPYLERILSQHTERHPILILKDVKYQELKCMMDYMYKGEVNISQEQLETFLKAAESLQIKGLTDSGSKDDYRVANHSKRQEQTRKPPSIQLVSSTSPVSTPYSHSSALNELNVRQTSTSNVDAPLDASPNSRDRSLSPVPRKKKRPRRPSQTDSEHFDSASETPVQIQSTPMINVPLANQILSTSTSSTINDGTDQSLTVADIARFTGVLSTENIKKEKIESQPDNLIVPKTEFLDDVNEDGVEDLTLEEDIENMDGGPGPSHSSENSNQGYGWSIAGERSTDEIFTSQDLANTAQDNQGTVVATKKAPPSAENTEEGRYKKSKEHEFPSESEKSPKPAIPGSGCLSVKSSSGKVLTLQQLRNVYCEGEVDPMKMSKRSAASAAAAAAAAVANASATGAAAVSSVESLFSKIGSQKQPQKPSAATGRTTSSTASGAQPAARFPAPTAVTGQQKRSGKINISVENLSSFISKGAVRLSPPLPPLPPPTTGTEFAPVLSSKLNQVKLIDLQKLPSAASPSKQVSRMPPAAPNEAPIAMVSQLRSISLTPVGAARLEVSSSGGNAVAPLVAPSARAAADSSTQIVRNVAANNDNGGSHVVGVGSSSPGAVAAAGSLVQLSQLPRGILDSGTLSIIPALAKNVPVEETAAVGGLPPAIRLPIPPALDGSSATAVVCGKIPGSNISRQIISSSECSTIGSATAVPATIATTIVSAASISNSAVAAAASSGGISSSTSSSSTSSSSAASGAGISLPQKVLVSEIGFTLQPVPLSSSSEKTASKVQEGSSGRKYMNWACRNKCGMVFTKKEDWLKHCKYDCEKRFRYNCEVCGKPFITNKRLKKHMNNHHSDANSPMDIPLDVPPTSSESQQSN